MLRLTGTGASAGIAIGGARVVPPRVVVRERRIAGGLVRAELVRLESAVNRADAQLSRAIDDAATASRSVASEFVELHREMLRGDLAGEAGRVIRERNVGAEWAVQLVVQEMGRLLAEASAGRVPAGAEDFEAVSDRLLRVLLDLPERRLVDGGDPGGIAVAVELSPLDMLQLERAGVVGVVSEQGGPTAHAVIVARDMQIPYVFGVPSLLDQVRPGDVVCVDGTRGEVIVSPDAITLRALEDRRDRRQARWAASLVTPRHGPCHTRDGVPVHIGANVGSPEGAHTAIEAGADHIGLVRTELLYLDRKELPDEEQQLEDALRTIEVAQGRPVTFRTLDLGGDKLPAAVQFPSGPNPALGIRAVRFSLLRRDVFRTQLRALLRASSAGPIKIMFPLVSGATELREAVRFCREVGAELESEGIAGATQVPLGTMVETPSAAITADHLAAECDFLSLGTNDLIQYAFAVDRHNDEIAYLYHPLHPAVLRLIQYTTAAATRLGKPVALCGDMAGDPQLTWVLLGLGLRELSMPAGQLSAVQSIIRNTSLEEAERLAEQALASGSEVDCERLVLGTMRARFAQELGLEDDPDPFATAGFDAGRAL